MTLRSLGTEQADLARYTAGLVSGSLTDLSTAFRKWGGRDLLRPLSADHARQLHGGLDDVLAKLESIDRAGVPDDADDLLDSASARVSNLRQASGPTTYRAVQSELRLATFEVDRAHDSIDASAKVARPDGEARQPFMAPAETGLWLLALIVSAFLSALAAGRLLRLRSDRMEEAERAAAESRARAARHTLSQRSELDNMLAMIAAQSSGARPLRLARKA
ncbi:hypothetical protein [Aureimonas leprariae]|uniref:Uncharacterized protein n=1 Tax=Plantimonas leprariae TaxID=2615207 RepID=A0A7V7PNI5_9HYPH|nr:hypothetical protein [Aureimonas leprariae]KAB0679320.1 hypothetical protein F6X38_13365 [Aureimonas leprariae]